MEQIADTTFSLRVIKSRRVKRLVVSMRALGLDYRNVMITATCSVEWKPTGISLEDGIVEEGGRKVVKEGFKIILLNERHFCSAVPQL